MSLKTAMIVQARMRSTRLPGKVMQPVLGRPLLAYAVERLRRVRGADTLIVATTDQAADQPIVDWCREHRVACMRGSETDVLKRYWDAAHTCDAQAIVRITSDCPLIDPAIVDRVIDTFQSGVYDYVSNCLTRTFPRGMDTEIFSRAALETAYREAAEPAEREHVTVYLYGHPERFRLGNVAAAEDHSAIRLTVDTPEDFELIRRVLEALVPNKPEFGLQDILRLLQQHPDWLALNAGVRQKPVRTV